MNTWTKWAIFGKNGIQKYESRTEYNSDGKAVYQDTLEYSGKWMGESFLTVSIKSAYPIDFQIGDYIVYRDEKYTINYDPSVIKKARRGTYGEGFVYDSIKFNSFSNELTQMRFHDWVLSDDKLHYTSLPEFSFYAEDVDDLADRLQACADRWCKANNFKTTDYWMFYTPSSASAGTTDSRTLQRAADITPDSSFSAIVRSNWENTYGGGESRDNERFDRTISVSDCSVWEGLAMVKSQFGLNFVIRGRNVYIGTAGIPTAHLFKYGKGNGLYEVDRTADQDQQVVTKLHAYGSGDNLPTRYYAELNVRPFGTVSDIFYRGNHEVTEYKHQAVSYYIEFKTDIKYKAGMFTTPTYYDRVGQRLSEIQGYVVTFHVDGTNSILRGMVEAPGYVATYVSGADTSYVQIQMVTASDKSPIDWKSDDETEFATFADVLAKGVKIIFDSGVKTDAISSENKYYGTENLPDNMAVNFLMLPGFPNTALADMCRCEYNATTDTTYYYITNPATKTEVMFHSESGDHQVTFSGDKHDPYILSPNAATLGIREGDISCTEENDDNGLEKVYPTLEGMTNADAGVTTGSGTDRIDAVAGADKVDDNGVWPSDRSDEVPGFNIYIPKLGFELDDAISEAGGSEAKITMRDGYCGGRTFDIANAVKQSDGSWRLNCRRSPDSSLDLYFPYSYSASVKSAPTDMADAYQILAGDHYVLTGISVSAVNYVWAASVRLLRKAIHWLCKNDYTRYVYTPKIDEIYMARQDKAAKADKTGATKSLHDTLKEGDMLMFGDSDLLISDGSVYIGQLTIKENGNNGIPTYEVVLRNEVQVGTLQRIQNKVDSIASDIRSGNVATGGSGGVTPTQMSSLTKAYGDKYFLSKLSADTAQGLITFLKGILLGGDGSYGISETGAATLLSLLVGGKYGITKDGVGTLAGIIADYLKSRDFREGYFDGHGFGLYKDEAGNGVMQVDKLYVTMKAVFAELEIRKLSYVGGDQVHSMAGSTLAMVKPLDKDGNEIADTDTTTAVDSYKCYYLDDDGTTRTENWWKTGDMAYCQTFNIEEGVYKDVSNRAYRRLVLRTGTEEVVTGTEDVTTTDSKGNATTTKRNITKQMGYVVLSNRPHGEPFELTTDGLYPVTDSDGNVTNGTVITYGDSPITFTGMADIDSQDAPAAEDKIVQIGSQCDPGRGYAYIIYVTEQRRVDYAGINDWDLASHVVAQYSPKGSYAYSSSFELRQGSAGGTWHPATDYRGAWQEDVEYSYYNTVTYDGLLWMQNKKDYTSKGDEPGIFSEVWTLVSGGGDLEIEFLASTDVINARGGDVTLEARLMMAGRDMTQSTLLGNSLNSLTWTRDSGIESEDKAWTPTTGDTANILLISQHTPAGTGQREDCGSQWARTRSCTFIFTAILRSKDGSEAQTLSKSISIS